MIVITSCIFMAELLKHSLFTIRPRSRSPGMKTAQSFSAPLAICLFLAISNVRRRQTAAGLKQVTVPHPTMGSFIWIESNKTGPMAASLAVGIVRRIAGLQKNRQTPAIRRFFCNPVQSGMTSGYLDRKLRNCATRLAGGVEVTYRRDRRERRVEFAVTQ